MTLDSQIDAAYVTAVQNGTIAEAAYNADQTVETGTNLQDAGAALADVQVGFNNTRRIDQGQTGAVLLSQKMGLDLDVEN